VFFKIYQPEGEYHVRTSVWNPLDGFRYSPVTTVRVLERIGPVHINEFGMVKDAVSNGL
jgi:hypothetical protein